MDFIFQAIVRYNEKKVETKPSFAIRVEEKTIVRGRLTPLKTCYSQELKICVRWLRKGVSNMAMIDVTMVSGFVPNEEFLNDVIVFFIYCFMCSIIEVKYRENDN